MAKRLKNLRITEVSSVDVAANPDARVLIAKRDHDTAANLGGLGPRRRKKPRNLFEHQEAARAAARAAKEKKMAKLREKMQRAFNKAARPPAPPPPLDTANLARQLAKGLALGETFEHAATRALHKVGATPGGEPETFAGVRPQMANTAITDASSAYNRMMEKAQEVADATGETREEAFERIYADPRNAEIVREDKRDHFLRATKAAGPLTGSTGPGLRPDQMPNYRKPVVGTELTEKVQKLMKRGLTFEAAATAAIRGKAA